MSDVNYIIETEAVTRWCPFIRFSQRDTYGSGGRDDNRVGFGDDQDRTSCLGSECMAWRWRTDIADSNEGFCGLAGSASVAV